MSGPETNLFAALSQAIADRVAAAAPCVAGIRGGRGRTYTGILWRADVVVASEQTLPKEQDIKVVLPGGAEAPARIAGRDNGTNVAVLRLAGPAAPALPKLAPASRAGELALVLGWDGQAGAAARLAMIRTTGPAWHSLAGGKIDRSLRLDVRLGSDEGGPVLDASGGLIGMSTAGPRRTALVIPAETIERVIGPLLAEGRIPRGWLGLGMQPVMIPEALQPVARHESGLMVLSLAAGGPAQTAGVLPGDILLEIDGQPLARTRAIAASLGPERIGHAIALQVLRGGAVAAVTVIVGTRPD